MENLHKDNEIWGVKLQELQFEDKANKEKECEYYNYKGQSHKYLSSEIEAYDFKILTLVKEKDASIELR